MAVCELVKQGEQGAAGQREQVDGCASTAAIWSALFAQHALAEHACAGWAGAADADAHLSSRNTSAVAIDDDRGVKLQMSAAKASNVAARDVAHNYIADRFTPTAGPFSW